MPSSSELIICRLGRLARFPSADDMMLPCGCPVDLSVPGIVPHALEQDVDLTSPEWRQRRDEQWYVSEGRLP